MKKEDIKEGQKVKIRVGAAVKVDDNHAVWKDKNLIFTIEKILGKQAILTAPGFGDPNDYGNGSLYVYFEDLVSVEENPDKLMTKTEILEKLTEFAEWMVASKRTVSADEIYKVIDDLDIHFKNADIEIEQLKGEPKEAGHPELVSEKDFDINMQQLDKKRDQDLHRITSVLNFYEHKYNQGIIGLHELAEMILNSIHGVKV